MSVLHNTENMKPLSISPRFHPHLRLVAVDPGPRPMPSSRAPAPIGRCADAVLRFHRAGPDAALNYLDLSGERGRTMNAFREARLTVLCESKHCLEAAVDRMIDEVIRG